MIAAKFRNLLFVLGAVGLVALLGASVGRSSATRAASDGPPFVALGSVSSLAAYGNQNKTLCPGKTCYTPAQLQQGHRQRSLDRCGARRAPGRKILADYGDPALFAQAGKTQPRSGADL